MIVFDVAGVIKKLNTTNARLAEDAGIREGTLLKYKNGGYKTISVDIMNRLIEYCISQGMTEDMNQYIKYVPDNRQ